MNRRIRIDAPPWGAVAEIAEALKDASWVLVGGLMVQAHALLDVALLCSLVLDVKDLKDRMRGSDKKRIGTVWAKLLDINDPAWLVLSPAERQKGQDALRVLAS